jgi:hypothetical protein
MADPTNSLNPHRTNSIHSGNPKHRFYDSRTYYIWRQIEKQMFGHNYYNINSKIILYSTATVF